MLVPCARRHAVLHATQPGRILGAGLLLAVALVAAACGSAPSGASKSPTPAVTASTARSPGATPVTPTATPSVTTTTTPSVTPTESTAAAVACGIVSFDEINSILGTQVGKPTVTTPSNLAETDCTYDGPNQIVVVDVVNGENEGNFNADKAVHIQGQSTTGDLQNLGQAAYYITVQSPDGPTTIIWAFQSNTVVEVSGQASLVNLETLMAKALSLTT